MDNPDIGYIETPEPYGPVRTQPRLVHMRVMNHAAEIARELVVRWGVVAAKPDGEDTIGRQKLALQDAGELVERACVTADLLVAEFHKRGWYTELPMPQVRSASEDK